MFNISKQIHPIYLQISIGSDSVSDASDYNLVNLDSDCVPRGRTNIAPC